VSDPGAADRQQVPPLAFPSDVELTAPGSKSEANRLLVAAALSGATTKVTGASPSDDVRHLIAGLKKLGYEAEYVDESQGIVRVGPQRDDPPTSGELFCGNAGTALRFLTSVAAITKGDWVLTGDAHMQRRPIQPLITAWQQLGVDSQADHGCPPVQIRGGTCSGSRVAVDATLSSQFVSSLLLVGSRLPRGLHISLSDKVASRSYAQLTCSMLERVGVVASMDAKSAVVAPSTTPPPPQLKVGGDWSSAGVWTCLNHLTGSQITAGNLTHNSGQADERLGVVLGSLPATGEATVNVEAIPDQFPNLAVVAALRAGTTHLTGAENVRIKECDRIAVMARELRKFDVDLDEAPGGLTIRGGKPWSLPDQACIDPEADHRIAMAFALAGLFVAGVTIQDPKCVAKSYPNFWSDLERVRAQHRAVALVGMRAAGKTTLGRAIAKETGSEFIDTDAQFIAAHGPINEFVQANGWPAFRREEQRIVSESLGPGRIVALGGGAVESEPVRKLLADQAVVIWLRATPQLLRERLAGDEHRPSLTGAPVHDEVDEVLTRRGPLYRTVATRIIDAGLSQAEQVAMATRNKC
jgi:3-phosphoshikimate 1-carboxyvinyltransferase